MATQVDAWDEGTPQAYKHTLATVWKSAMEPKEALFLLCSLAFLDPVKIPHELFENGITDLSHGSVFCSRIE